MSDKTPFVLCILDGWGHRLDTTNNAIAHAKTPVIDSLWDTCPSTLISGSGMDVGLPDGQMGNSEVGHVNLGAGRIVYQDFTRISKAIKDGDFFENPTLESAIKGAVSNDGAVHIMGLLSPGGVHSHEDHILAMVKMAEQKMEEMGGNTKVFVHAFLDGRDTPPCSAQASLEMLDKHFKTTGSGKVASIIGRYYAMDRDNRWDRVQKAYDMLTLGESEYTASSSIEGLLNAYERDENDEFVKPTIITDGLAEANSSATDPVTTIKDGDAVIFMNFRADRAREITRSFVEPDFQGFDRKATPNLHQFVMLTEYAADIDTVCAFPPTALTNVLGEWLEKHNKTQLRISETEKYAHVTFFFSGGREGLFDGEARELIPSPQVATYDLQPEMNSEMLTDKLCDAIKSREYDFIVVNYPNGDMVGHTGVFDAAVKACEAVDHCVGRVVDALKSVGGECLITADHGNAEQMSDTKTGQAHTAHTSEPVPFIYVGRAAKALEGGVLSDVAPTILKLMGMEQPAEMTGRPLMIVNGTETNQGLGE